MLRALCAFVVTALCLLPSAYCRAINPTRNAADGRDPQVKAALQKLGKQQARDREKAEKAAAKKAGVKWKDWEKFKADEKKAKLEATRRVISGRRPPLPPYKPAPGPPVDPRTGKQILPAAEPEE